MRWNILFILMMCMSLCSVAYASDFGFNNPYLPKLEPVAATSSTSLNGTTYNINNTYNFINQSTNLTLINESGYLGYWNTTFINDTCYINWSAIITSENITFNQTLTDSLYVPYTGATKDVDLGIHNISINGSILFKERTGIQDLFYVNPINGDGFRMSYYYDFELANDDWLVFKKTDGNDAKPDGGIAFMMANTTAEWTILKFDGYGTANFTNYNIITIGNISVSNLTASLYCNSTNCYTLENLLNNTGSGNVTFNQTLTDSLYYPLNTNPTKYLTNYSNSSYYTVNNPAGYVNDSNFSNWVNETGFIINWSYLLDTTTYYPSVINLTGGSLTDRNWINDTYWYDGLSYNVTESAGATPVLDVYINYSGVTDFNEWIVREYYLGSSSHNMIFDIYDYDSSSWETYYTIVGQAGFTWVTIPIFDATEHISGGLVQTRIIHQETGVSSHRFRIDVSWLIDGVGISASTNLAGYAKYSFGYNNFSGYGNFSTSGYVYAANINDTWNESRLSNYVSYTNTSYITTANISSWSNMSWNETKADSKYVAYGNTTAYYPYSLNPSSYLTNITDHTTNFKHGNTSTEIFNVCYNNSFYPYSSNPTKYLTNYSNSSYMLITGNNATAYYPYSTNPSGYLLNYSNSSYVTYSNTSYITIANITSWVNLTFNESRTNQVYLKNTTNINLGSYNYTINNLTITSNTTCAVFAGVTSTLYIC